MVEVSLTVGKLDASLALLLTKDHHLIEFPTILLPDGVNAGSVVTIKCEQDLEQEKEEKRIFQETQDKILELFGTNEPKAPVLKLKNVTQTSAVLEWDPVDLGSASIKSLSLYKNGSRLGQIPNPLVTTTTKLSGLQIDAGYEFHLRLSTTAGVYESEHLEVQTHKMTDLSGITVCIGQIDPKEGVTLEDIEHSLKTIGAKPSQTEVKVDTTHFVTTVGVGEQWQKATDSNIPVVRPEWLKACETERRIVGVRNFYLNADPRFLETYKSTTGSTPTSTSAEPTDTVAATTHDEETHVPAETQSHETDVLEQGSIEHTAVPVESEIDEVVESAEEEEATVKENAEAVEPNTEASEPANGDVDESNDKSVEAHEKTAEPTEPTNTTDTIDTSHEAETAHESTEAAEPADSSKIVDESVDVSDEPVNASETAEATVSESVDTTTEPSEDTQVGDDKPTEEETQDDKFDDVDINSNANEEEEQDDQADKADEGQVQTNVTKPTTGSNNSKKKNKNKRKGKK
ncbi:CHS5 [Cyberlindnera jadinii]|uniref:Chitin biosynthesis protein CHS5 n=1 Tax=Cyberlindnera jadinii (strain ATCC 18201 / CBS 1600 / BCRC 20928 / JCM 3617 / NBRC 0987 / NRRL Y-1542) TaxID=983966 RepID=A0A0H5CBE3_CYBJN|nr:CHS5 [Cyberlindnera jadinii]